MPKQLYKYTVVVNGVKFTRGSNRLYTHCLVGQRSYAKARAAAETWTKEDETYCVRNYHFHCDLADGSYWTKNGFEFGKYNGDQDARQQAEAKVLVAGGLDAFREHSKREKIETVESYKARGHYDAHVISYHGSEKSARSQAQTHLNRGFFTRIQVVEIPGDDPVNVVFDPVA